MPVLLATDPRIKWGEKSLGWAHTAEGMDGGRFGQVVHLVYVDGDYNFLYDRPAMAEGPHAIAVAYTIPPDGVPRMLLVKEQRDAVAPLDGTSSAWFWGPPRGFAEPTDEGIVAGASAAVTRRIAMRETVEEGGYQVKADSTKGIGEMWVNETCVSTPSPLAIVEVDVGDFVGQRDNAGLGEVIADVDFFTLAELNNMIRLGEHQGACTRSGVFMSSVKLFELFVLELRSSVARSQTVA